MWSSTPMASIQRQFPCSGSRHWPDDDLTLPATLFRANLPWLSPGRSAQAESECGGRSRRDRECGGQDLVWWQIVRGPWHVNQNRRRQFLRSQRIKMSAVVGNAFNLAQRNNEGGPGFQPQLCHLGPCCRCRMRVVERKLVGRSPQHHRDHQSQKAGRYGAQELLAGVRTRLLTAAVTAGYPRVRTWGQLSQFLRLGQLSSSLDALYSYKYRHSLVKNVTRRSCPEANTGCARGQRSSACSTLPRLVTYC